MRFDSIIKGGTIVDGTGSPRVVSDIGLIGGKIAKIGQLDNEHADKVIDATGLIVAPGVIDTHTHYDAQINWDPYCTNSGWHGMTTAVLGNCGFGYAPVRPDMHVRYMKMMVNTEQIPYAAQAAGLAWTWETFPQWLDHLRTLPKGVNVSTYVPLNPLLVYVMGVDAAKSRPANADERRQMREILHEAMDHGAIGFAFSYLGTEGNSHLDFDMTPMPTDTMAKEEAYNLCDVLRERGEGMIQLLADMPGARDTAERRAFCEELARRSGQRVVHNVIIPVREHPEHHREALLWLDSCASRGLDVWSQSFVERAWNEFNVMDMNAWDCVPVFRVMTKADTVETRMALVTSSAYRERLRREYDRDKMYEALGPLENHYVIDPGGAPSFAGTEGQLLGKLASDRGAGITDLFLDLLIESEMRVQFGIHNTIAHEPEWIKEIFANPRVLAGSSDGGAHGKFWSGGQWSTDLIMQMVRETGTYTLEELHHVLGRAAKAFHLADRGTLEEGKAADILIYDYDKVGYTHGQFEIAYDLPGNEWRRISRSVGFNFILVNGVVTFESSVCTDAVPGKVLIPDQPGMGRAFNNTALLQAAE
jgi:N-acyl-D-amino-acid deacylase